MDIVYTGAGLFPGPYIIFYLDIKKTGIADTISPVNTEYDTANAD
ncbi:unnamed protein product [marine sediment metagenome]|uniref:Uncharacterized protein n=1 Tax=marine sediment metagenome TaxID=412755 RepID=X0TKU6_9ZZZZ